MSVSKSRMRLSPAQRRRLIADRQKSSLFWKTMHVFGSMKLALFLLAAISIACATATIMESKFTTEIAQAYIYKAPWFIFWLALLCINLFAATITRWPWLKRHTGFIITHYGIIILLVGAVIGSRFGFEGNVTLTKGGKPATRIITSHSVLQIQSPIDEEIYLLPYNGATARPSEKHPTILKLPGPKSDYRIVIDDYAPQMQREPRIVASDEGQPATLLRLHSNMMAQPVSVALGTAPGTEQDYDFFGMARIVFRDALPTDEAPRPRETRMVFAKFAPVSQPGDTNPLIVTLSEDGKTIALTDPKGHGLSYEREEIQGKEISTPLGNVKVVQYWPNFEFKDGKPVSLSQEPRNPAALVFLDVPTPSMDTQQPQDDTRPLLEVALGKDTLDYRLSRNGHVTGSGSVQKGESFALGWGDWTATAEAIEAKGRVEENFAPIKETPQPKEGIPGLRARLQSPSGERGEPVWLVSGNVGTIQFESYKVRLGYGLETRPMDFSMSLLSFEVPRDEGTEKPSDFVSRVLFVGNKSDDRREATVHMNHPASYPGKWWNLATGINYKFSQAQWDPKNLDETTYQVLYDPGWLFKWIGSLAVCAGIAITFYWKPKSQS